MSLLVQVRGLARRFQEAGRLHPVFEELDLDLARGERVALLGPSGSGKSTLLNLLAGIDVADAGSIVVDGTELTSLDESARTRFRREHLGFVFQFFNLIPTLTVAENLRLPLSLNGLDDSRGRTRIRMLLEQVGLGTRADSFPERLSGGEQQRVACLRAVVHEPTLLLADEPTGNLDADTGERVMRLLLELVRERQTTLLVVTHSAAIARVCDRVLQLDHGRLREVCA